MKKKILSVAFIAAIAIVGGLSFNQNKINVSDLALNNIEALAWDEGGVQRYENSCKDPYNPSYRECSLISSDVKCYWNSRC